MLNNDVKKQLIHLARQSITSHFNHHYPDITLYLDDVYEQKRGAFVTLHKNGQLRGCIGYIIPFKNLRETIIDMAKAAAFRDPRFKPVKENEMNEIDIEISVLSEMICIQDINEIVIGRDGLLIEHPYGKGVLLPQVATEYKWDTFTFLTHLALKAGLNQNQWQDKESKLYRFSAEVFGEKDFY